MSDYQIEVRDGKSIRVYDNGMEMDVETGRLLRPPTRALITSEKAHAYIQRRIDISQAAKIRALAGQMGVDVENATDEELLQGYQSAQEAVWAKGFQLILDAKSGRSIEALFSKLIDEERSPTVPAGGVFVQNNYNDVSAAALEEIWRDVVNVQEGKVTEIKGEGRE